MAKYDFNGTLVLVTGGGSGIGRAICKAFAESGASVVVADINLDGAKETVKQLQGGNDHTAIKVDVSSSASIKELADNIKSKYNRSPSVVIHSAAIMLVGREDIFDITHEEWDRVINVNLKGTFMINQTFGRSMRDEKINNGSIVNISSIHAYKPFHPFADYGATKTAAISVTRSFAMALAKYGIRVNAVAPGCIDAPMLHINDKHVIEECTKDIPMGRIGQPEEVARLCLFLASNESSYITGQSVLIAGGIFGV